MLSVGLPMLGRTAGRCSSSVAQTISTKLHVKLSKKSIRFTSSSHTQSTVLGSPMQETFLIMSKKQSELQLPAGLDLSFLIFPAMSWLPLWILLSSSHYLCHRANLDQTWVRYKRQLVLLKLINDLWSSSERDALMEEQRNKSDSLFS